MAKLIGLVGVLFVLLVLASASAPTYSDYSNQAEAQRAADTRDADDSATRLPIRTRVTVGSEVESELFFTYPEPTLEHSHLPANFFRLDPPSKVEQERELARRYRASHGLSTDPAIIEQSLTDPTFVNGRNRYGVGLSPAETTRMDAAIVVQRGISAFGDAADDDSGFAGIWMDAIDSGQVVFAFTTLDPLRDARLRGLVEARGGTSRFEVHQFTVTQLESVRQAIEAHLRPTEAALGVRIGLVDAQESADAVEVGVADPSVAQELRFKARFGPSVKLVRDPGPQTFSETSQSRSRLRR